MKKAKKRKPSRFLSVRYLGCAVFCVLAAYLVTLTFLNRANTLFSNGRWTGTKTLLVKGVNGGAAYMVTRRALFRDVLDLSAWFGFQEVIYKKTVRLISVDFEFFLEPQAYLAFVFDKDENFFKGVRLSQNKLFPSLLFEASTPGEFMKTAPFSTEIASGWNRARAVFEPHSVSIEVNGRPVQSFATEARSYERGFGFRGGSQPAYVRNVAVKTENPQDDFTEDFRNRRHFWMLLLLSAAALSLLGFVAIKFLKVDALYIQAVFAFVAGVAFFFDSSYLWSLYPDTQNIDYSGFNSISTFEGHERAAERIRGELLEKHQGALILYVGTSQTWGAGVFTLDQTYAAQTQKRIDRDFGANRFYTVNTGLCGGDSNVILPFYRDEWIKRKPKAVVVDLSNNDQDTNAFSANLKTIAQLNKAQGIGTLFLLEANAYEGLEGGSNSSNREAMRAVAKEFGITVIDLHEEIKKRKDSGFLWWDPVHFTPHADKIVSDAVYPALRKLLN